MPQQTELFNRRSGQVTVFDGGVQSVGPFRMVSSTTWMLRHALMADFKVRAACKNLEFRRLRVWSKLDEDGDELSYVLVTKRDEDGKLVKDRHGRVAKFYVYDENHQPKTRKRGYLEPTVQERNRKNTHQFPSDAFPTDWDDYYVTGDDGTTWEIGSRGNDIGILVQEVANNPYLRPEEKRELVEYLRGARRIPSRHATRKEDPHDLHRKVDGYFCERIIGGHPVTEDEIRESGLPDETVENLIHNLRAQREHHVGREQH